MNGENKGVAAEPQRAESKMGKYFRYFMIAITLVFFIVLAAGMIIRKLGG